MDRSHERLATILDHLVSFPTVADNADAIHSCVDWVRASILTRSPRLSVQRFTSHDKPSLLFIAGKQPPRVLLCGHIDVVEAFRLDAYHATTSGDERMQGRGTADMKGPVAALIDIMESEPQSGLGLLLTADEEIGGEDGVGHFLRSVEWRPEVVIMPDGGANMRLVIEQKGILRLRIVASGTPSHSARPWLGESAIERLMRGYHALSKAYPMPADEDDWRVSIALTDLHAGIAQNVIPWQAEAILDIRYPASGPETGQHLASDITRRLARHQISTHVVMHAPTFTVCDDAPMVQRLQCVARALRLGPLPVAREAGASDARYFSQEGVPVLMFQPECRGWHTADEWVSLPSLAGFRTLCLHTARSLLARTAHASTRPAAEPPRPTTRQIEPRAPRRPRAVALSGADPALTYEASK